MRRVTTPDGASPRSPAVLALQRANVTPEEDPLADLLVRAGTDGRFRIPSLSTGAYRLTASAEGYGSLARAVTLSTGSADVGDLLLPGGATLTGALRRADGAAPSADALRRGRGRDARPQRVRVGHDHARGRGRGRRRPLGLP